MSRKTHTYTDMYESFRDDSDIPASKQMFKSVISSFNQKVMDRIIYHGEVLELGWYLSDLSIIRVEQDPDNANINWKASNELKQEIIEDGGTPKSDKHPDGEPWLVYFDSDWFAMFYWRKSGCTIPNKTVYSFRATRGDKGNKTKLKKRLREDDLAFTDFRLVENIRA